MEQLRGRSGRLWERTPSAGRDGLLLAVTNSKMRQADAAAPSFVDASFNCIGDRFAAVDDRGRVFVFFLRDNKFEQLRPLGVPASAVQFSAKHPNELAIALCDSSIGIFNTEARQQLCRLTGHKRSVRSLSFHPRSAVMISASEDGAILWDTESWTRLRSLGRGAGIISACFVGAEELIAVAFKDDSVMLWDVERFELRGHLTIPAEDAPLRLREMTVSDDGEFLAVSGLEPTIYVWNVRAQLLLHAVNLSATLSSISQLHLLPGGKSAVVLGGDGKVVVSNITSQQCQVLLQITHAHVIGNIAVNRRGSHIVALTGEAAAIVYDLRAAQRSARQAKDRRRKALRGEDMGVKEAPTNPQPVKGRSLKPVFQLAQSTETERLVTRSRLQKLVLASGEFPSRYRSLIWKFLLRLPENKSAFEQLTSHGIHPAFVRLHSLYPIQNQHLFGKLQTVLSAVAHWAPVFGEVPYLPAMAFPFVKVLEGDMLAAFETVLSLVLHWGGSWLETFPHPPLRVLGQLESMLAEAEPELAAHLSDLGLGAHEYGWGLLRSLFTEVLGKEDWLALIDHLFAFAGSPGLLIAFVVAYLKLFRAALLAGRRREDVEGFLHTQHPINIKELASTALSLRTRFSTLLRRAVATTDGHRRGSEGENEGDEEEEEEGYNDLVDTPWPLPVGSYPAFARYPKAVVDFQIQERRRLASEEIELERKRELLRNLEVQSLKLHREAEASKAHQAELQKAEEVRRTEALARATKIREEQARLDEEVRLRRLEQLAKLEENAQLSLAQQMALREAESHRITDDIQRAMDEEEYRLQQRRENEALLGVEFQSYQRVAEVQRSHSEAAFMQRVEEELQARQREAATEDKLRQDAWTREDEERRAELRLRRQRAEQLLQVNEAMRSKRNVDMAWATASLERESKLAALEHERRMRLLLDRELQGTVEDVEAARRAQELVAKEEEATLHGMIDADRTQREEQQALRERLLEQERRRHELEAEMQRAKLDEAEREQRRQEFEAKLESHRAQLKAQADEEEKEIQKALFKLENERQQRRKEEVERVIRQQELAEARTRQSAEFQQEEAQLQGERQGRDRERQELREAAEQRERDLVDQHNRFLARVVSGRAEREGSAAGKTRGVSPPRPPSPPSSRASRRSPSSGQARRSPSRRQHTRPDPNLDASESSDSAGELDDVARMAREVLSKHKSHKARSGLADVASSDSSD